MWRMGVTSAAVDPYESTAAIGWRRPGQAQVSPSPAEHASGWSSDPAGLVACEGLTCGHDWTGSTCLATRHIVMG
jgi:hypothetical protein